MNETLRNITVGHIYIFFRGTMFYHLELKDDNDAILNAEINNGTTRVEDINGRIVWECNT